MFTGKGQCIYKNSVLNFPIYVQINVDLISSCNTLALIDLSKRILADFKSLWMTGGTAYKIKLRFLTKDSQQIWYK